MGKPERRMIRANGLKTIKLPGGKVYVIERTSKFNRRRDLLDALRARLQERGQRKDGEE